MQSGTFWNNEVGVRKGFEAKLKAEDWSLENLPKIETQSSSQCQFWQLNEYNTFWWFLTIQRSKRIIAYFDISSSINTATTTFEADIQNDSVPINHCGYEIRNFDAIFDISIYWENCYEQFKILW